MEFAEYYFEESKKKKKRAKKSKRSSFNTTQYAYGFQGVYDSPGSVDVSDGGESGGGE